MAAHVVTFDWSDEERYVGALAVSIAAQVALLKLVLYEGAVVASDANVTFVQLVVLFLPTSSNSLSTRHILLPLGPCSRKERSDWYNDPVTPDVLKFTETFVTTAPAGMPLTLILPEPAL